MRVLLVEDEPEMAAALGAALKKYDMVVDHFPTLADAEEAAAINAYDAVLLDRQLPDGDGLALIAKLRAIGLSVPRALGPMIAPKGSLALDGVSLTVNGVRDAKDGSTHFSVNIIPHTAQHTTLGGIAAGRQPTARIEHAPSQLHVRVKGHARSSMIRSWARRCRPYAYI